MHTYTTIHTYTIIHAYIYYNTYMYHNTCIHLHQLMGRACYGASLFPIQSIHVHLYDINAYTHILTSNFLAEHATARHSPARGQGLSRFHTTHNWYVVCVYECIVCLWLYIYMYTDIYVCVCVCGFVYMYMCMYVRTYVCICSWPILMRPPMPAYSYFRAIFASWLLLSSRYCSPQGGYTYVFMYMCLLMHTFKLFYSKDMHQMNCVIFAHAFVFDKTSVQHSSM